VCALRIVEDICLQTLVLEGAKFESNNTNGTDVGNGYTRYDFSVSLLFATFLRILNVMRFKFSLSEQL